MKKLFFLLALAGIFGIGSCAKNVMKKVDKAMTQGSWKVTKFLDDNQDETSDFAGCVFVFNSDGSVTVTNNMLVIHGLWDTRKDGRYVKFVLTSFPVPFDELNDDWFIASQSDNKLELKEDNNDTDDLLTFEKL